ncbi:MAG: hypothetical protein U0228_34685 [Myxococcaceae bacterium]
MTRANVLLSGPSPVSASAVESAARTFELDVRCQPVGAALQVSVQGALVRVTPMPGPVANAEADTSAFLSLSAANGRWRLGSHAAHLSLSLEGAVQTRASGMLSRLSGATREATPIERLALFTRVVAAVTKAAGGVGVHWIDGPVTHAPDFFAQLAVESPLPLPLWVGVSLTPEAGERSGVHSFGMQQLGLPDLFLLGPGGDELPDTIDFFFSALATVAERGTAPVDGETIARSLLSRPRVQYGPSPVDPAVRVWRLDVD